MTRNYKFRAKTKYDWNGTPAGVWIYGNYFTQAGKHYICETTPNKKGIVRNSVIEVDEKTLGQFTGLLDKNGKEIYEGDIIMVCNSDNYTGYLRFKNYEVVFDCGAFKIVHEMYEGQVSVFETLDVYINPVSGDKHMEIIGNIYENPDLLTTDNTTKV